MRTFTLEEIETVINDYTNKISTVKISKKLKTSPQKIKMLLLDNGIDIDDPNNTVGFSKKPKTYWNETTLFEVMVTCRTRREFATKYSTAYKIAKEKGIYNKIANKVFSKEKNLNSFNEKIHIVYSYEFKEYNAVYIGRTLDLKRRHRQHQKDINDSVYKFCIENKCQIPDVNIIESGLTGEESQIQENFWLEDYLRKKWYVINKSSTGLNKSSMGSSYRKWDYEKCKIAASKCNSKEDFKNKFVGAYNISRKHGWIYDFFKFNLKKENGCFSTFEQCIDEIKKFKNLSDIRSNYPFLYQTICKNKWNEKAKEVLGYKKKTKTTINHSIISPHILIPEIIDIDINKLSRKEFIFYHMIYMPSVNILPRMLSSSVHGEETIFVIEDYKIIFAVLTTDKIRNKKIKTNYIKDYSTVIVYDTEITPMDFKLRSKIESILNVRRDLGYYTLNARQCIIKEITYNQASAFLNNNHIQGDITATVYLGAFCENILVAVMTFNKGTLTNRDWELTRFATDFHYIVRGAGGKMFQYFIKHYKPTRVISFADRRWTIFRKNLYTKIGFKYCHTTPPSYKYLSKNNNDTKLYNKFGFRKKTLLKKYPDRLVPEMTETEMVKELGYDRIWDCGLIKYVWTNPDK